MLSLIDLRGRDLTAAQLRAALPRASFDVAAATDVVRPLMAEVRERGEAALLDQAERFDHVRPAAVRVAADDLTRALHGLEAAVRAGLELAIERVGQVHRDQVPREHVSELAPGAVVRQRWVPVRRVGLYVPGGLAVYPSSVVMNAVAAQAAGVPSLALASPAQARFDGLPHPTILAACALLGIDEVYAAGGAGAIALLAYGATTSNGSVLCEPVDVITGPGNVYVAAAKREVRGLVGIDAEAGPTEIMVLADANASVEAVAADLLSQAEHDPLAGSVLVTDSEPFAIAVREALTRRARSTRHAERVERALTGSQSAAVLVDDMAAGVTVANAYGAEHLEIVTHDAPTLARAIYNAGAIFVGAASPVPLGDYVAGSNHVLPTGGTARFASGLGVMSFVKSVQQIEYDLPALRAVAAEVIALANAEDLPAHGEAIEARLTES